MDFFDDDLSPESELLDLEPDTQDYGEMTQETAQLLQRTYELPTQRSALLSVTSVLFITPVRFSTTSFLYIGCPLFASWDHERNI